MGRANYKLLANLDKNAVTDFSLFSSLVLIVIGYVLSALRAPYLNDHDQVARQRDVLLDLVKTGHGDYYERMNRCMEKFLKDLNANQPENRASL